MRGRRAFIVLLALAFTACERGPEAPVANVGAPAPPGAPERVEVLARAVDLRPQPIDSAEPVDDRRLAIRFWGGVAPCHVVGRVDVIETAEEVRVTLFTGRDPAPGSVACIEIARYQEVVVDLSAPLGGRAVVDGSAP